MKTKFTDGDRESVSLLECQYVNIVNNGQTTKLDLRRKYEIEHKGKIDGEHIIYTTKIFNYIFLFFFFVHYILVFIFITFHWCVYLCISQSTFFPLQEYFAATNTRLNVALILLLSPNWL